jgi:hypothetical protein
MFHKRLRPRLLAASIATVALLVPGPAGAVAGFGDVESGRFYSEGVQWLADSGITTGTSPECFSPDAAVTRGQAAAFLWRMEGRPPSPMHPFRDVEAVWQQDAISWMAAERVTTGTSSSTFSPDQVATRAQIAAFLHRLAGEPPAHSLPFVDLTADWQRAPVAWMAATGITTGTSPSTFSPDDPVTRGQLATFLHRYKGRPPVEIDPASPYCDDRALTAALRTLIAPLDPARPAYNRDLFFEGADLDNDCVRTRHEVLQEEALEYSMSGCRVIAGTWFDPFTAAYFYDPTDLEVDHVVALADAWRSGAWAWGDTRREVFSNDLANLNAIRAEENSRKSDAGPASYRPANGDQRCAYLVQYGTVKVAYRLSITQADYDAVSAGLADCSSADPDVPKEDPTPPGDCHPAYLPCLPNLDGDELNCGDLDSSQKPVTVLNPAVDPYGLDGDSDGIGCE